MKTDAFDGEAVAYDEAFEGREIARRIRSVVWSAAQRNFQAGDQVLDLGCGTATDAIMLAQRGIRVTAIDSSARMIQRAGEKISLLDLGHMIELRELTYESLENLDKTFNGVLSNFGALNCSSDLSHVFTTIHSVLRPGASMVICLLNKYSLWEMASFLLRGKSPFRRWRNEAVPVRLREGEVQVKYYSLTEVCRMIERDFQLRAAYGLSIVSPPPGSNSFISTHPGVTERLLQFEEKIRSVPPWRLLGDHILIEARRRER